MERMKSAEEVRGIAADLMRMYLDLGERARLSKATLARIIGAKSQSRLSGKQLERTPSLPEFVAMKEAVERMQQGLQEGWLPAAGKKGTPQDEAYRNITGFEPESSGGAE